MQSEKALKSFAKKLTALSLENGVPQEVRVDAVLKTLLKKPGRHLPKLLKYYLQYIRTELAKTEAVLEYAGAVEAATLASIEKKVAAFYNHPIHVTAKHSPELLAGIRMRIGNDVWEQSAANMLETLRQKF